MTAIDLKDIVSNGDNTREPAPALQGMGYGVVVPVEGADRPTLFYLALGTPEDKRRYCLLVERHEGSLVDLAASIDREGQLLNCRVRPTGQGKYVLTFGARRCLAVLYLHARHGKPAAVWATVSEGGDDRRALVESAAENAHRLPPSYIDQARLFRRMRDQGMTVKEIAALYPMGRSAEQNIRHRLRLLELSPEVQVRVHHGRLSQDAALKLLKSPCAKGTIAPEAPQHENRGLPDAPPAAGGELRTALRDFIARLTALDLGGMPSPADADELLRLADEARRLLSAAEEKVLGGSPALAR